MAPEPEVIAAGPDPRGLGRVARIKRALEWLRADRGLRQALRQAPERGAELAAERGLELDFAALEPLWREGFRAPRAEDAARWPLVGLWADWEHEQAQARQRLRQAADPGPVNPAFSAWRGRVMARNRLALGVHEHTLTYPAFAYELSQGCSQGCWFCALEAGPLTGVFPHTPANARLWRELLAVGAEVLGPDAGQSGFCYWASEPADNPDYLAFLDDFQAVNGSLGPTTSAAATRDPAWTRALVERYAADGRPGLRFSVLSLAMLAAIHRQFSPEDLLMVDLLAQNPESILPKSRSGRARDQAGRWERQGRAIAAELAPGANHGGDGLAAWAAATTACLAGFLVNLVEGSVRLVSPCPPSAAWPRGYRVHAQGRFRDALEYRAFLRQAIAEHLPLRPPTQARLRLNPGLTLARDGQVLICASPHHRLRLPAGDPALGLVAGLAAQGRWRTGEAVARAVELGADYFSVLAALETLWQQGLIDDDSADPGEA